MATPEEAQKTRAVEILGGVARDISHPVAAYFRGLLEEGLATDEALYLAADFARKLLAVDLLPFLLELSRLNRDDIANPRG